MRVPCLATACNLAHGRKSASYRGVNSSDWIQNYSERWMRRSTKIRYVIRHYQVLTIRKRVPYRDNAGAPFVVAVYPPVDLHTAPYIVLPFTEICIVMRGVVLLSEMRRLMDSWHSSLEFKCTYSMITIFPRSVIQSIIRRMTKFLKSVFEVSDWSFLMI